MKLVHGPWPGPEPLPLRGQSGRGAPPWSLCAPVLKAQGLPRAPPTLVFLGISVSIHQFPHVSTNLPTYLPPMTLPDLMSPPYDFANPPASSV